MLWYRMICCNVAGNVSLGKLTMDRNRSHLFLLEPTLSSNHPSSFGPASGTWVLVPPSLLYSVCVWTGSAGLRKAMEGVGIVTVVLAACFFNL